jgi:hypothetical protein
MQEKKTTGRSGGRCDLLDDQWQVFLSVADSDVACRNVLSALCLKVVETTTYLQRRQQLS